VLVVVVPMPAPVLGDGGMMPVLAPPMVCAAPLFMRVLVMTPPLDVVIEPLGSVDVLPVAVPAVPAPVDTACAAAGGRISAVAVNSASAACLVIRMGLLLTGLSRGNLRQMA
jgi:hypothetical protein